MTVGLFLFMEFLKETNRKYYFKTPDVEFDVGEAYTKNGVTLFDKSVFESIDQCEKWVEENMNRAKKITKDLHGIRSKALVMTEKDWELMQAQMINPDSFQREDFKIYESWLAHNFKDRDNERFTVDVLKSFQKTIVGKSLLYGHNWGDPGEGRFYKARIEKMSVDEAVEFVGPQIDRKFKAHLENIAEKDGAIYWLVPTFYMLADNESAIKKIDAGITRDMSIGFNAPGRQEVKADEKDEIDYYEYVNTSNAEAEAFEGSFVFLGAQPGASVRKDANGDPENKAQKAQRGPDEPTKHKKPEEKMAYKFVCPAAEIDMEINEDTANENIKAIQDAVTDKIKALQDDLKEKSDALESLQVALGEHKDPKAAKNLVDLAQKYRESLENEALKWGQLCGVITEKNIDEKEAFIKKADNEVVIAFTETWRQMHDEKHPGKSETKDDNEEKTETKQSNNLGLPDNCVQFG